MGKESVYYFKYLLDFLNLHICIKRLFKLRQGAR
nr:MAG TPA: hypothetical protein [Microviridae sp.]